MSLWRRVRRFLTTDKWNVGIVRVPIAEVIRSGSLQWGVQWLPEIQGGYIADPFAVGEIDENGDLTVLAEVYNYRSQRGRIGAVRFNVNTGHLEIIEIPSLNLDVHMSYPFLFQDGGQTYCVPETHGARAVYLYRAVEYPFAWVREAVLLEDFPAVDATVFRYGNRWWMLATNRDEGDNRRLYAWYADALTGPWMPHARNPIKDDISSARPAGKPFLVDGELYRPAQDSSNTYGGRVVIHRITRLTPEEFQEEVAMVIPPQGRYSKGLHTIVPVGDLILIDGKRHVFAADMCASRVRYQLSKLRKRFL